MVRNLFVSVFGMVLSLLLFMLGGWILFRYSVFGKIAAESVRTSHIMDGKDVVARFGDPFKSVKTIMNLLEFLIFPLGVVLIGGLVGLTSKKHQVVVSVISVLPFVVLNASAGSSAIITASAVNTAYLGLSCLSTYFVAQKVNKLKDLKVGGIAPGG